MLLNAELPLYPSDTIFLTACLSSILYTSTFPFLQVSITNLIELYSKVLKYIVDKQCIRLQI